MGAGVTGQAVVRRLLGQGWDVSVYDDRAADPASGASGALPALGALVETGARHCTDLEEGVAAADLVVPSPGVPQAHAVYAAAARRGVPLVSEIELAFRQAPMPLVAITGTNGKTTVATMVAAMLRDAGYTVVAAGNIGLPLIDAVHQDVDVVVAEVSSFQLQYTDTFRPVVGTWLNLAEDHLDWHPSLDHYAAAKARIWANQTEDDTAVVNADDDVVMQAAALAPSHVVTFGVAGEWRVEGGVLRGGDGEELLPVSMLPRAFPHDVANALAAAATAVAAGASMDACRSVLASFAGLPHRVELVSDAGGVRWYDDSKATTPASVLSALQGFDSVVLIAGGRNKGLDLGVLRAAAGRLRAVVAIGEAADAVVAAFDGVRPVTTAASMADAVQQAAAAARPGDAVLLSPGCASYDWYTSYAERGEDFTRLVRDRVGGS
ncbi:MAG: UDP-N-acetylmuramoylalanine--D-glutamate ligase [Acidimicrobiaceae bacterium]|nr:UDP-N-acetylmuramoylalanine--D-glutamate ligase [Acidimicrobiaceae bacterium]